MGHRMPNTEEAYNVINKAAREINSHYTDGFTALTIKQEMYGLYFHLKKMLKESPTFHGEEEWLEEQFKNEMWEELKK